jgi:hypothetical protein
MRLFWTDFNLEKATLTVRGERGKSADEKRGRVAPISRHLVEFLAGLGVREGFVIPSGRDTGTSRSGGPPAGHHPSLARAGVRERSGRGGATTPFGRASSAS